MKSRTSCWTKFCWLILPQVILLCFIAFYLIAGAKVFQLLDPVLANKTISELVVFEMSTLATIGYGDTAPTTTASRAFCIAFSVFGIPLFLLAVGSIGKHVNKLFWMTCAKFTKKGYVRNERLPLPVAVIAFFILVLLGARHLRHSGERNTLNDIYFSFISFSTVGFGDMYPLIPSLPLCLLSLLYLTIGIVLLSSIFTAFHEYLRKLHHIGRRFRGARDVQVWMGGRSISVSKLLAIVGKEFAASPREIREVLRDLDCLILSVIDSQSGEAEEEDKLLKNGDTRRVLAPNISDLEDFSDYE